MPWVRRPKRDRLTISLVISLALHALILSVQFGVYDVSGLSVTLTGTMGAERRASVPSLQAALRGKPPIPVPDVLPAPLPVVVSSVATVRVEPKKSVERVPEVAVVAPRVETVAPVAVLNEAVVPKTPPVPEAKPEPEVMVSAVPVLETDRESTWSINAAKVAQEIEEKARNERIEQQRASEAEALERKRLEQLEVQRKAEAAAIAKANKETMERQRIEAEKKAEQAALAKAREEATERARLEEEKRKAEQAVIAKAREEALAKTVAAEAAARARQEQLAEQAARVVDAKPVPDDRGASQVSSAPGRSEGLSAQQAERGGSLAARALEQIRSGAPAIAVSPIPPPDRHRRGSILGRDPKDIQLAFYGEGWRQKVERIGSMNYPKLSKNRHYDPLVVTVSINSDGTLAGLRIDKSSGHKDIDDAVRRIVEMSAPFAVFPPDLKRSYDVVDITRTWSFLEERPRIYSQ